MKWEHNASSEWSRDDIGAINGVVRTIFEEIRKTLQFVNELQHEQRRAREVQELREKMEEFGDELTGVSHELFELRRKVYETD